jgi:uncharacterized membrane protein YkvA (DUF1232 family)
MTETETVARLQRMVDSLAGDIEGLQVALADARTPDAARRVLGAALIYVVDRFDLVPDHIAGIGLADDATVLRLAAKVAVSYGADDAALRRLASEAADLAAAWGDLLGPLEDYLNQLQWHAAPGKTPAEVIADPEMRVQLWRDLGARARDHRPQPLAGGQHGDAANVLGLLRRLVRARLQKAGLLA